MNFLGCNSLATYYSEIGQVKLSAFCDTYCFMELPTRYNLLMTDPTLSHLDKTGKARMVDVSEKAVTQRLAVAEGELLMKAETLTLIRQGALKKGDALTTAQIAGIQAAKRTAELIPFCHPLPLDHLSVDFELDENLPGIRIRASVRTTGKTGVEMEALTAVTVASLTLYDMAKSAEKTMTIQNIRLVKKKGGQSGEVRND